MTYNPKWLDNKVSADAEDLPSDPSNKHLVTVRALRQYSKDFVKEKTFNKEIESVSGTSGTSGSSGTSGVQGPSGTSGTSGVQGPSGTSGTSSTSGTSGSSGSSGTSGTSGSSGSSGTSGTSGTSAANKIGTGTTNHIVKYKRYVVPDYLQDSRIAEDYDPLISEDLHESSVSIDDNGDMKGINDLTVSGNLFVDGTTFIVNKQEVSIEDNIIVVNRGEVGPAVTSGSAGIEVDRGSSTNYQLLFEESSETFRVGEIESLQAIATREDNPIDTRVPAWNDRHKRYDTDGITFIEIFSNTSTPVITLNVSSTKVLNVTDLVQVLGIDGDTNITITQASDSIIFESANVREVTVDTDGLALKTGVSINEFSIDGTLSDNSDNAVATEKAVKTYVDNEISKLKSKLKL